MSLSLRLPRLCCLHAYPFPYQVTLHQSFKVRAARTLTLTFTLTFTRAHLHPHLDPSPSPSQVRWLLDVAKGAPQPWLLADTDTLFQQCDAAEVRGGQA